MNSAQDLHENLIGVFTDYESNFDAIHDEEIYAEIILNIINIHKPAYYGTSLAPTWCIQCADGRGYAPFPCPTIQAIEKGTIK